MAERCPDTGTRGISDIGPLISRGFLPAGGITQRSNGRRTYRGPTVRACRPAALLRLVVRTILLAMR